MVNSLPAQLFIGGKKKYRKDINKLKIYQPHERWGSSRIHGKSMTMGRVTINKSLYKMVNALARCLPHPTASVPHQVSPIPIC